MRVVATESFKTYYRMVCIDVAEGEEFDGDFADFLVAGGCAVEPAAAAEQAAPQDPSAEEPVPADPSIPSPDNAPASGEESDEELDITGTAASVLEWVGDDPDRAAEAHAAESAKDKPRSTLLKKLDEITGS